MRIFRMAVQGFSIVGMILISSQARADFVDHDAINAGQILRIPIGNKKDCSSIQTNERINLLVEGIDAGIHPLGCNPENNNLTFELRRSITAQDNTASEAAWEALLGNPWRNGFDSTRSVSFTVEQSTDKGIEVLQSGKFSLHLLPTGKTAFGIAMIFAIWAALYYLARHSGMIRDAGNSGTSLVHRTFSLGRTQMAWWFAIIIPSYIFLWIVTDGVPTLGSQALGLMGISGASGLVSAGLDKGKQFPISSGKFFIDLLTDADGITIHRFQMLSMTVVLGVIYIFYVVVHLKTPEFDNNTLAILGISGLTYLGFKIPEKQVATSDDDASAADTDPKSGYTPLPQPVTDNQDSNTDPKSGYTPLPQTPAK